MLHMRTARAFLAMLVVLAGAGVVSAQTKTQTQIGGWNLEGEIESGLRGLVENPNGNRTPGLADGKFEEYRDINGVTAGTGLFLENLHLRLFRPDEAYSVEMTGKNWGLHTQEFHLLGERLGQWQTGFDCDGQISQQWFTGRLFFKLSPSPNTDLSAELTRIFKDGQRPFGMAFSSPGGNFAELIQPISQTIYEFRLRGGWMTEMFQLQGGYTASVFVNDFPWVRTDNPCNS